MIHSIYSNHDSFHRVDFIEGLNIVMAKRSDDSTEKDTYNGVGKSTLLEIIDFCLGSNATQKQGLIISPLNDWTFTLDITLLDNRIKVTRGVSDPDKVTIEGPTFGWPVQPDEIIDSNKKTLNIKKWRENLGELLFKVPQSAAKYRPSYRNLIHYFIRRGKDAYVTPFGYFRQQPPWNKQVHVAFLLGLNWEYAIKVQVLKDQESALKVIETLGDNGVMGIQIGNIGELETQQIKLDEKVKKIKSALDSFNVHPQYREIEQRVNNITKRIQKLLNINVTARRRLSKYEDFESDNEMYTESTVETLFAEAEVLFPEVVKKTLNEVREFHKNLIVNRSQFVDTERKRMANEIEARDFTITELSEQRAGYMRILQSHGALDEMLKLQEQHTELQGELNKLNTLIKDTKRLKKDKRAIKKEKTNIIDEAEVAREERKDRWSAAVRFFNENTQSLYKTSGDLIIEIAESGYKFKANIERGGSEGIDNMKIFCFDLAVLQLQRTMSNGIDFLIHDTLMYDSVDPRQRALAFERAAEVTSAIGSQYICTINEDMVPRENFSDGFDFDSHIRLILSDASPADSLLGIRFERDSGNDDILSDQ